MLRNGMAINIVRPGMASPIPTAQNDTRPNRMRRKRKNPMPTHRVPPNHGCYFGGAKNGNPKSNSMLGSNRFSEGLCNVILGTLVLIFSLKDVEIKTHRRSVAPSEGRSLS